MYTLIKGYIMKQNNDSIYIKFADILVVLFSIFIITSKEVSTFQIELPKSIPVSQDIKIYEIVNKRAYVYESGIWVKSEKIPKDVIVLPNIYNIKAKVDPTKIKVVLLSSLAHNMYYEYGKSKHKGESIVCHIDSKGDYTLEKL
jgi:hypothetical protein